jgi:hypothetical protein
MKAKAVIRKSLASCGISFRNLRYHLNIAVTAFLPVALSYLPIAFIGNSHKMWWGSLIMHHPRRDPWFPAQEGIASTYEHDRSTLLSANLTV